MYCPQCGEENEANALACSQCATALPTGFAGPRADAVTSGLAILSFVLGISGLPLMMFCLPLPLLLGIPAIIVGIVALRDIRQSDGERIGSGFAIAGIVLGLVVTLISLAMGAVMVLFVFMASWQ